MSTKLYIDEEDQTQYLHDESLSVDASVGGRDVLSFELFESSVLYRPSIRQTVVVTRDEATGQGDMAGGSPTDPP